MAKRLLVIPVKNEIDELPMKRAKFSEPVSFDEKDTVELMSLSNYSPSVSSNEFSSESEDEGHAFPFQTNTKPKPSPFHSSGKAIANRKKPRCISKNAVMARINRVKKKMYIEGLEMKTAQIEAENKELRGNLDLQAKEIDTLKREVLYLKNVIRNRTEIGTLLKCIRQNTDLNITSSILGSFAPTTSQGLQPNVSMNNSKNDFISPMNKPTFWSSDEEGKTPVCSNNSPSLINDKPIPGHEFLSPIKSLDEFNFDHDPQSDHDYFAESKVSRFEMESPECILPELGSELDDFNRCETPTKGTNSEFESYFADEDLGFNLGICLHVANKQVSLEFCDSCNHKASLLN